MERIVVSKTKLKYLVSRTIGLLGMAGVAYYAFFLLGDADIIFTTTSCLGIIAFLIF